MSAATKNLNKLADIEERAFGHAGDISPTDRVTEARRRITWSRQWLTLARTSPELQGEPVLEEASRHLRTALDLLDQEDH